MSLTQQDHTVGNGCLMGNAWGLYLARWAMASNRDPNLVLAPNPHKSPVLHQVIEGIKYSVSLVRRGVGLATVSLTGTGSGSVEVAYRKMGDGGVLLQVGKRVH